jgi:SAM-dependent methyltransferase
MHSAKTITDHYETLLARRYVWMLGGAEAARASNDALADRLGLTSPSSARALDLGGGPGFFAVALARRGFSVDLVDTSAHLLEHAARDAGELPVRTHVADLREFLAAADPGYRLITCLGDTLTHLPHRDDVAAVFRHTRERLAPGGELILTYRDLSHPLEGIDRFLPVRSDADRIFTCFLEHGGDHVQVTDIVYEREAEGWSLHKSTYRKRVLPRAWVENTLTDLGFAVEIEATPTGMLQVRASV